LFSGKSYASRGLTIHPGDLRDSACMPLTRHETCCVLFALLGAELPEILEISDNRNGGGEPGDGVVS